MPIGDIVAGGMATIGTTMIAISDQKKQQQLEKFIAKLNAEQQAKLEGQLQRLNSQIERERLLFQAMALERNNLLKMETSKDKTKSVIVLSLAIVVFGAMILISRKR